MIPEKQYNEILKVMPRACVDILITCNEEILLLRRLNNPHKGYWGLPGGMVNKGESLEKATVRKCKEELGLKTNPDDFKFVCISEYFGKRHDVVLVYSLDLAVKPIIKLDSQHDKAGWFNDLPRVSKFVRKQIECFKRSLCE